MNSHANKTQEKKKQSVANKVAQKQSGDASAFQFEDNRPGSFAQRKLQEMATNSPQAKRIAQLQEMANNSPQAKPIAQLQEMTNNYSERTVQKKGTEEEELLQGKFKPIQKQEIEEEELLQGKFKTIQKQEIEEEELIQGKFEPIQKKGLEENELQMKEAPIRKKAGPELSRWENNTGLPDNLKAGVENLSGYSVDDVKVHRNSDKPAHLQAHAYAQGTDIHLGPGQEKHLPHEAWHVVQQKHGRLKPTMQMEGEVNINDDAGLEKEADVMGAKALSMPAQLEGSEEEKLTQISAPQRVVQNSPVGSTVLQLKYLYESLKDGSKKIAIAGETHNEIPVHLEQKAWAKNDTEVHWENAEIAKIKGGGGHGRPGPPRSKDLVCSKSIHGIVANLEKKGIRE